MRCRDCFKKYFPYLFLITGGVVAKLGFVPVGAIISMIALIILLFEVTFFDY